MILTSISSIHGSQQVSVSPISILFDPFNPMAFRHLVQEEQKIIEMSDLGKLRGRLKVLAPHERERFDFADYHLLGRGYDAVFNQNSEAEAMMALRSHASITLNRFTGHVLKAACEDQRHRKIFLDHETGASLTFREGGQAQMRTTIVEEAGKFRMVVSLLCLLNAKDREVDIGVPKRPPGSSFIGGKVRPYAEFRHVRLRLPEREAYASLRSQLHDSGMSRRRHGVRGHWCNSRRTGDPACAHDYHLVDGNPNRLACRHCGHKRWFRPYHERGDASLGYVSHDYVVEKGKRPSRVIG
jgi:hypothetical protein